MVELLRRLAKLGDRRTSPTRNAPTCCDSSSPRARSSGPPSSSSKTPTSRSRATPTSTTAARSTTRGSIDVTRPAPPGDPALRRGRPLRRRHHRPRLGRGDRRRRRDAHRAALLEGDGAADPDGARGRRRLAGRRRSRTCPPGVRVHTEYPELTRRFFDQGRRRRRDHAVVRRDRGEDPRDRRRGRRDHRDRPCAARRGPQDPRHDPRVVHRADREPARRTPTPRSARRWSRSRRCSPARSRRAGGCCVKLNVDAADLDGVIALLPGAEVADGVEALRRGRLRGRDRRREVARSTS